MRLKLKCNREPLYISHVGALQRPLLQAEKLELFRYSNRRWKISDSLDLNHIVRKTLKIFKLAILMQSLHACLKFFVSKYILYMRSTSLEVIPRLGWFNAISFFSSFQIEGDDIRFVLLKNILSDNGLQIQKVKISQVLRQDGASLRKGARWVVFSLFHHPCLITIQILFLHFFPRLPKVVHWFHV